MRCSGLWLVVFLAGAVCAAAQEAPAPEEFPSPPGPAEQDTPSFAATPPPPVDLYGGTQPAAETEPAPEAPAAPEETAAEEEAPEPGETAATDSPQHSDPVMEGLYAELDRRAGQPSVENGEASPSGLGTRSKGFVSSLAQATMALLVVLALILFIYFFVKKKGKGLPLLAGGHLGSVLGRLHLSQRATLHFVRAGGRVLVVGVTANDISLIAEFDEAAFGTEDKSEEPVAEEQDGNMTGFLAQLKSNMARMKQSGEREAVHASAAEDADIASLKGEIHRLQEYLREPPSDSSE